MAHGFSALDRNKKIGVISALSCCGCGGLALLLIVLLGVLGATVAPEATEKEPASTVQEAAPAEAASEAEEPAPSATPTATSESTPTVEAEPEPTPEPETEPAPAPETTPAPEPTPDTSTALGVLATLEVKGRAPKTGYDRDLFGWRDDVDHNGCDTRNDVLRRDLGDIVLKRGSDGCVVLSGTLAPSPFSGEDVVFDQQADNNLDIDHVVALSDAWQSGAGQWEDQKRREFANDPLNLIAVEDHLNQQKGDGDAATWLPPNTSYRCEYVSRQIAVKAKYDLWVKPAEKDAMEEVLEDCAGQAAFADDDATPDRWEGEGAREQPAPAPEPAPAADPAPVQEPAGDSGSVVYQNCDAVRAAGKAPILAGDPGYSRKLDRDGDGVGCE